MLSRSLVRAGSVAPKQRWNGTLAPSRGMATAKQLKLRIKTVNSIKKITSAMKLISTAKMRHVQNTLAAARVFAQDVDTLWPTPANPEGGNKIVVAAVASDKGLCGSANSTIVRQIRDHMLKRNQNNQYGLVVVGDKAKAGLERLYGNFFKTTISETRKFKKISFKQVALMAGQILKQDFDQGLLWYNKFKNMMTFTTTIVPFYPYEVMAKEKKWQYSIDIEDNSQDEVLKNFYEYRFASQLFCYTAETDASEMMSRVNAMNGAEKNAKEMLKSLNLKYARVRQAKVTTELIELSAGAEALNAEGGA